MANPEHLAILKQGVEQWNKWRREQNDVTPDLSGVDLADAERAGVDLSFTDLTKANLVRSNLAGSSLVGARLAKANLGWTNLTKEYFLSQGSRDAVLRHAVLTTKDSIGACLCGANLGGADLSQASLVKSDLRWADLSGTILDEASLHGADLRGANLRDSVLGTADFTRTIVGMTNFADVDLSRVRNLDTVDHRSRSTIGTDTVYKSRGRIPEAFLRGCGVPDEFIAYIGSMVGRPIEFYSCFISYSTKDQEFAERLHADLQAKGVRCWFAPEEMKGGRKLHEQIDEAIRLHDKLLLILSEHSMSSNWVKTEIANAREREKREGKQLLFPITLVPFEAIKQWKLFDADIGIDSAREIREYFIPDFSNWKEHDSYQTALQRLVKDLKAGAGG